MTEFTTALAAGLIGLIGTGIGAAATAWAAKIGAKKNVEAVRGQAQDQAASEHAHWLRQQRLAACEGFLDAWDECTRKRKELTRPVDGSRHDALRAELWAAALRMVERARRISLLGPEQVSLAAETISEATLENVEKEDEYGQYLKSALSRLKHQERQVRELSPDMELEEFREALRYVDDLEKLKEQYSVEQLERIVDQTERSVNETQELIRRLNVFAEMGREINDEGERFLGYFERNIKVAEESRVIFVATVREAISSPSIRDD